MSQTVHPYSHRLGIIRDWKSRWFARGKEYRDNLHADTLLREFFTKRLKGMNLADVHIERPEKRIRIVLKSARPGLIIGRNGEGITLLRKEIEKLLRKNGYWNDEVALKIDVEEVRYPEADAMVVAQMVAEQLEKRMPFRRVLKQTAEKVMANREVQGVRIQVGGRLGGADMARTEQIKKGRIPLQTFRADIDYAHYEAKDQFGIMGIKVWIYRGDIVESK